MPNSESMSTSSPSVKMNIFFLSFLHVRTTWICCAATDSTGSSIRLNSSKQPQLPDWARPGWTKKGQLNCQLEFRIKTGYYRQWSCKRERAGHVWLGNVIFTSCFWPQLQVEHINARQYGIITLQPIYRNTDNNGVMYKFGVHEHASNLRKQNHTCVVKFTDLKGHTFSSL